MTYRQTIDFLYSKLPMFTRVGSAALKNNLHNITAFCAQLNNPQHTYKTIHIAGTNGKGSVSHMLAAILQEAGFKTGLYTSPHLKDFRERIRVNGKMVSKKFVTNFVQQNDSCFDTLQPSFFEATVAMAFSYFADQQVDIAVIEVGLGGRLDATNIITPQLSVITNISMDHTNLLGNTLPQIAAEKAGIIKPGVPVIIGEYNRETAAVFTHKAQSTNSEIVFADQVYHLTDSHPEGSLLKVTASKKEAAVYTDLALDLTGVYQQKNILTVIAAIARLNTLGFAIEEPAIRKALSAVRELTGLQGRWQTLSDNPLTICDTGHNEAGIKEVLHNIANTVHQQLHFVIGMVKDKEITKVLSLLPGNAVYYFCAAKLERALPATELAAKALQLGLQGNSYTSVGAACKAARAAAQPNDLIFIGGSTFIVAEAL